MEPTPLDLDGNPRFVDDPLMPDTGNGTPPIVDMGAFEFQFPVPIPTLPPWGLLIMALALLAVGSVVFRRRRVRKPLPLPDVRRDGLVLHALGALLASVACTSVVWAQIQVGQQIRIDVNGGTAAAKTTAIRKPRNVIGQASKGNPAVSYLGLPRAKVQRWQTTTHNPTQRPARSQAAQA